MERLSAGGGEYELEARRSASFSSSQAGRSDYPQQQRHIVYPPAPSETFRKASLPDSSDENGRPKLQIGATTTDLSEIKPISVKKQITVSVESINAYVPILFQQKSFLSRLNPLTIPSRVVLTIKQQHQKKKAATHCSTRAGETVTMDVEQGTATNGDGGTTPPPHSSSHSHSPNHPPKMRQVLYNVSCTVHPGEVLALMGPSGSGKTTLLTIMGNRAQKLMKVDGSITYNDSLLTKKLKRQVGFVSQDDLLYEALTVYETLLYAAKLRLPSSMSKAEKKQRVETVIAALGLNTCRDTIIGGFFRKGVSGGERKRTSVAHELLINPSLIFLDEPTSGLDSTTAMHLLKLLRHLASGGRSIATTIHQPSSRLYQQLDRLMLLSQGHVLYYGAAEQAVEFFSLLGYTLPYRVNAADFLLDLASGDVSIGGERGGEESRAFLVQCSEMFLSEHPSGYDDDASSSDNSGSDGDSNNHSTTNGEKGGSRDVLHAREAVEQGLFPLPITTTTTLLGGDDDGGQVGGGATKKSSGMKKKVMGMLPIVHSGTALNALADGTTTGQLNNNNNVIDARPPLKMGGTKRGAPTKDIEKDSRWGASFTEQIAILFQRSLRTRRFEVLSHQDFFQVLTIAILAGLFWLQKAGDNTVFAAGNTVGLVFFILLMLSFRAAFLALFTFPSEFKMMLKERASGMYRLSAFYIARMLSDLPMDLSLPTLFFTIVYWMGGLRANAAAFFAMYGTVILSVLVAQGIGLLLGAAVMNPKTAQTIASVTLLIIVLTGGFFVTSIASWISWLRYLSFVYYALGLMLYIEFDGGHRQIYSCIDPSSETCALTNPDNPESDPNCSPVQDIQAALGLSQNPSSSTDAIRDGMVLLAFFIALRLGIYVVLRHKTQGL